MDSSHTWENWEKLTHIDRLGELLVKLHVIKLSQLTHLLEKQRAHPEKKLGELAIEQGLITPEELRHFLDQLQQEKDSVALSLHEMGHMTEDEKWQRLLQHQHLGELLIQRQALRLSQLIDAMQEQKRHPEKKLGQILIDKHLITKGELESVLSLQYQHFTTLTQTVAELQNPS